MAKSTKQQPVIMICSTVYGFEELLDRIYALLTQFGYNVWCSHAGTMPTNSNLTAFENCLKAVGECDLFFGLITPQYGSGIAKGSISITHQEIIRAIELNKPRWLLAHDHVVFARTLLANLGHKTSEERAKLTLRSSGVLDDLRVIDMYEAATRNEIRFEERTGNWVQKFVNDEDALRFATAQFYRFQEVEKFLEEQFKDPSLVMASVDKGRS